MQSVPLNLPVGWKFGPTDEQLLDHYLKKKRLGHDIHGSDIQDIQVCDFAPWELLDENSRDKERHMFCRREFISDTRGTKRKRKAKGGCWKRTGEIQFITLEDSEDVIGTKTILVYQGPHPGKYVMHEFEYTAELDSPVRDGYDFVICKLMVAKKKKKKKANEKGKKVKPVSKKKAKKARDIEVNCKKSKPNKKARKGLSFCDTAPVSVPGDQNLDKVMAYSAHGEGEPSKHLTSNFEYQNPSNIRAYLALSEGEDQSPNSMARGESSHRGASDFEFRNSYERGDTSAYSKVYISDLNSNQIPKDPSIVPGCKTGGTSGPVAADLDASDLNFNQICKDSSIVPSYKIAGSNGVVAADLNSNQIHKDPSIVPGGKIGGTSGPVAAYLDASDLNFNQSRNVPSYKIAGSSGLVAAVLDGSDLNPYQIPKDSGIVPSYKLAGSSGLAAADLDNNNPNVMAYMSLCNPGCLVSSWIENQNQYERTAVLTNQKGEASFLKDFVFENINQNKMIPEKGKLCYLLDSSDFGNQNPSDVTDIPATVEGIMADDLENQIPNDRTGMSPYEIHNPGCASLPWVEYQNPYDMAMVSTNKNGETSCLTHFDFGNRNQDEMISEDDNLSYLLGTLDFGNQNPSTNPNISTSLGGEWNATEQSPPDFGKRNQHEKTDTLNSECCRSALLTSGVQETAFQGVQSQCKEICIPSLDDVGTFSEIDSEKLDDLTLWDDLVDALRSEPTLPVHATDSLHACGSGTSSSS